MILGFRVFSLSKHTFFLGDVILDIPVNPRCGQLDWTCLLGMEQFMAPR